MTSVRIIARILPTILVCLWVSTALAQPSPTLSKVAILPFTMNAPNDLAYMKDSIRDMLTSRLAWQGKVQVIDRASVDQAMRSRKTGLTPEEAVSIGKGLKADYVLFGTVTAIGKAVSIDAKMVPIKADAEPVDLYSQANSLDEVIPKINQFAELVNRKVFGRSTDMAQSSTEIDTSATMNPELLIPQMMMPGGKISYLNPNFLEVTPEGALRQPGLWRSQTFNWGILGMDVGDLDGDGQQELVTVSQNNIIVYKRIEGALKAVANHQGDKLDRFTWVVVVDANKDGRGEIFVTNLRRYSQPEKQTDKGGLTANVGWDPSSLALSYGGAKLTVVADKIPYFLSAVELSQRGKILIGQRKGTDNAFRSEIFEMQLVGNTVKTLVSLPVPSRCNVFNFAKWDINGDGADEVVVIDHENKLLILNSQGDQIWKSDSYYGATSNMVEAKVVDSRYAQIDYVSINSPILITDLNKDGIPEIIVNDNLGQGRFMPEGIKYYDKSQLTSLSWNQLGLVENWKTMEVGGMVTAFRIGDLTKGGVPQLIGSMVLAKDFLKIWDAKSTVFSYDLNIAPTPAEKKGDRRM